MTSAEEYLPSEGEAMAHRSAVELRAPLPAAPEAEELALASMVVDPNCVKRVQERFGNDEVWTDLRHRSVFECICFVVGKGDALDQTALLLATYEELKTRGQAEMVGGLGFLSALADKVPSAACLDTYLDLIWEKYVARSLVRKGLAEAEAVVRAGGASESFVARVDDGHQRWRKLLERGSISPKNLRSPGEFEDAYYDRWFGEKKDAEGWELPFKFPMRIRPNEMTLMTGDNGSGKSSMLGQIAVVAGHQFSEGQKVVIASLEVPPEITLWIMARQLIGKGHMERNDRNIALIVKALGWLEKRVLLYDFLGITDWRELLNTFRYAREHKGGALFIVDSVMRVGIPDDDYAQQGVAAAQFADFCVKTGAHTFLVVHENKGDGEGKAKIRGSKQWSDNAHNVVGMKRNEKKALQLEEWRQEFEAGEMSETEHRGKIEGAHKVWDSKFLLHKQRYPGSQQNGSRWLYFHHESLQFHEQPGLGAMDYLHSPSWNNKNQQQEIQ